jgi:hypothetical protein
MLPWVHKAISNAKRLLLDVHHRIDDDFLQNYLNAYVFKLNRRYFISLFDRVLVAAVTKKGNCLGKHPDKHFNKCIFADYSTKFYL